MVIPFFSEQLANINAIRATIAVDPAIPIEQSLTIKRNALCLNDNVIVDFDAFGAHLDPRVLTITLNDQEHDVKLALSKPMPKGSDDLLTRWTAKELQNMQGLSCRECQQRITSTNQFQSKDLPSEHWYELVECWICHEAKPEEHRARMQPISARAGMVLAGATYVLLHPQDLLPGSFAVDDTSHIKWDAGLSAKWIPFHCTQCEVPLGEGQYERGPDGELSLLAAKFYKYCIAVLPVEAPLPTFLEFFVYDLFDASKAHATYRFLIQGRQSKRVYALVWLFNVDTNIIYNRGFMDPNASDAVHHERVIKLLYMDCTQDDKTNQIEMWAKDKTADQLMYPESCCQLLVETLRQSTATMPPAARMMNNPAMTVLHNFSVGFVKR
ncbi:HECT-like ubiquitin-conjugating enzyme-binding-domain-containing protein [Fennellomyces sp. T-0311]|nr:HECT-like ubiquitin-conjugating enzyme-binding-domain-containing protein [Fennellomyces sp. T-0311]